MRSLRVPGTEPGQRAAALAAGTAGWLFPALAVYDQLFAVAGLTPARVRLLALAAREALCGWAPELSAELDDYARVSGLEPWRVHALNARTELLAAAAAASRGECSTIAGIDRAATGTSGAEAAGTVIGAQTWDWHQELAGSWAVLEFGQAELPFVTLTEAGLLAKIGVNAAGVALLFNILSHSSDTGEGGVPVHAVARRILDSARDVEQAIAILRRARLAASSCFTLLDPSRVACLEASPAGVAELPPAPWMLHTNHFLAAGLRPGALPLAPESDTEPRLAVLATRMAGRHGGGLDSLVGLLCAHESEGAAVCCHPAAGAALGSRWQPLATIGVEPGERRISVLAGGPCGRSDAGWRTFQAG
jgi:isopenicillin-N N-acyltransferase like protein